MKEDEHTYLQKKGKIVTKSAWLCLCILMTLLGKTTGLAQNATKTSMPTHTVFDDYFAKAQQFAVDYPREKVYLHFDNNSYYQGDTIWYKAYVVTAADNCPSHISKPLHVDILDQLGNILDRQTIRLTNGEGSGYISLSNAIFTGYYEVRAYTKWMMAFDDPQYFSRVLPVYRKRVTNQQTREIAEYSMDETMKQRPKQKLKKLNARFFPEGGPLVQGVASVVGMETLARDSGWVNVDGYLLSDSGERLRPVSTVHDGMGSFTYTPTTKPGMVELTFGGKSYRFDLPAAEPLGYVLQVTSREDAFDVNIMRSTAALSSPVALFLFSKGVPCGYFPVDFGTFESHIMRIKTDGLPVGTLRMSLVNADGRTLNDRFCFVYPRDTLHFDGKTDDKFYAPFKPTKVKIRLIDGLQRPVGNTDISVSIRDGIETDYRKGDDNICSDLLLTSDLKGYVDRPAFYIAENTAARRQLLDNLLIIHGWRQYNLDAAFGKKTFKPLYQPEKDLTLYGHIRSWWNKPQAHINVSVLAQNDSSFISGTTYADSLANFSLPIEDFDGEMEALIQTHRDKKRYNRNAYVYLFRNFEPELHPMDADQLNPRWDDLVDTQDLHEGLSAVNDSISDKTAKQIDEVQVVAKRKKYRKKTSRFEREILAFYNVRMYRDRERDEGRVVDLDPGSLLRTLNPHIDINGQSYDGTSTRLFVNGHVIDGLYPTLTGSVDMIETILIYMDHLGLYAYSFNKDFQVQKNELSEISTDLYPVSDQKSAVNIAFQMNKHWNNHKDYKPTHGIRRTFIYGYETPAKFYTPVYDEKTTGNTEDARRTLYWNPDLKTDANGEATIECYNAHNATFLDVSAETLVDGKPAAVEFTSLGHK